jgi:Family of unknown function (DUF6982)
MYHRGGTLPGRIGGVTASSATREAAGLDAIQDRDGKTGGRVVVRLRDNEILEGFVADVDLDKPDICLVIGDRHSNNSEAFIPLVAIKNLLLSRREYDAGSDGHLRKVAVHYWDGEVLKGLLGGEPERRLHAMALPLVSPTLDEIEVFAIPYAAVKGVFFVKSWDSRAPVFEKETGHWSNDRTDTPLLDLLGEIRVLSTLHVRGDLDEVEFERRRREVLNRI